MPWAAALIPIATSAAGAIAGAIPKQSGTGPLSGAGPLESMGTNAQASAFGDLQSFLKSGPGQQDIADYTKLLQQARDTGIYPTETMINKAQNQAGSIFAPQQTALNQNFQQQRYTANQQALRAGRDINDPSVVGMLGRSQALQQQQLNSQQGAYATQLANQQAQGQLDIAGMLANQAFSNRQALFGMGNQLATQGWQQRFNEAPKYSGGGAGEALSGGLAGFGAGAKAYSSFYQPSYSNYSGLGGNGTDNINPFDNVLDNPYSGNRRGY